MVTTPSLRGSSSLRRQTAAPRQNRDPEPEEWKPGYLFRKLFSAGVGEKGFELVLGSEKFPLFSRIASVLFCLYCTDKTVGGYMDKTLLAYAVEQEQVPKIDTEELCKRAEAREARVHFAHRSVFLDRFGWSEHFPDRTGYYYFVDCDDDTYVLVEVVREDGELAVLHVGSDIPFPPETMDGKWKPVPVPTECLRLYNETCEATEKRKRD